MKVFIETGSGSHTTSSASCQAKFVGGPHDGQFLYQHKESQTGNPVWDTSFQNERWVTTVYDLPEGTQIALLGKGRTGPRGINVWAFHRVYELDPAVEVVEIIIPVGLRDCTCKGRLKLVRDILEEQKKAQQAHQEEGF